MARWNPWHGCSKISEGCRHCYVYRIDGRYSRDSSVVYRTRDFDLPVRRCRDGRYKIPSGETVYTCFSSDFLLDAADEWRGEAWAMMRLRSDLHFFMITKRIDRLMSVVPDDWRTGYSNVTLCCTVENQERADSPAAVFKGPYRPENNRVRTTSRCDRFVSISVGVYFRSGCRGRVGTRSSSLSLRMGA